MLSSPVHRHKSPAEVSQSIKNALQWFRQRPLVAVVSFILFLLLASVFVPFLILDYFSGTGGGPGPGGIGAAGMAGAGGVGAGLISSRGLNTMHLKDLRTALGIESRTDPLVELAAHGKEYAAKRGGDPAQAAGAEGGSPVLSFLSELATSSSDGQPQRAAAVVAAFKHAYGAYDRHCFGQDEYHPMSKKCSNWIGSGLTIIDAMSTMMIMGLKDEVQKARSWIESSLTFSKDVGQISFFETTIRVLGGLISAYDLSGGDKVYLDKAKDLGDRLIKAFNTPTGYPHSQINLATGSTGRWEEIRGCG
jgi:hypothetical protein